MNNSKLKLNYYSVFFKNTWGLECLFQHLKSPVFFFLFSMNQQYGAKSFSQQISLESIYELSPLAFGLISYREKLWIRCLRVCYYSHEFILVRNLISQKYYIFSLPKTCAFVMRFFISLVSKASITLYASGWQNWDCFPFCNIILSTGSWVLAKNPLIKQLLL